MEAGAVAFAVAGAMLLVMGTTGIGLQQLQKLLSSPPNTWLSQSNDLPWPLRLFGLASMTAIASFFGNAVAGGFASLVILYWIVQYAEHGHGSSPPSLGSPGAPGQTPPPYSSGGPLPALPPVGGANPSPPPIF